MKRPGCRSSRRPTPRPRSTRSAAIPARYALERGRWREAEALTLRPDLAEPGAIAVTHFARAIGAARAADTAEARSALAALASVDDALAQTRVPIWPGTVHAQRLAASAWLALAEADTASALRLASEAADLEETTPKHPVTPGAILPARELQGDLLLAVRRPVDALAAYTRPRCAGAEARAGTGRGNSHAPPRRAIVRGAALAGGSTARSWRTRTASVPRLATEPS